MESMITIYASQSSFGGTLGHEKLEPNEIDLSQGFSQNVISGSCSVLNSLPASGNFCHIMITFANSLDPDQA